jgi:FkbM family methyltransferase
MTHLEQVEKKLLEIFENKKNGFFVDIGAHDGISINNTKLLEDLGWDGICIEPHPKVFQRLLLNRNCKKVNCAVWDKDTKVKFLALTGPTEMLSGIYESYDPKHYQRIQFELQRDGGTSEIIEIDALKFESIVTNEKIDFMSIDTEGSELQILERIDYNKYDIELICVENNFFESKFEEFFITKGYHFHSNIGIDFFFKKIRK